MNAYPGPFKCPDCGLWWSGFEHRCQPTTAGTLTTSYTVRCTCSFDAMGHRIPTTAACPLHDEQVTFTTGWPPRYGTVS